MRNRAFRWILNFAILACFIAGAYMIIRSTVLFPPPYEDPPAYAEPVKIVVPQSSANLETMTPEPTETARIPYDEPVKIYFTSQKIATDIIPVGVDEKGTMEAPEDSMLGGWLKYSVHPGEAGNSIIAGHDSYGGVKGVFSIIKKLELGDEVVIQDVNGVFTYYTVMEIGSYLAADVPDYVMAFDTEGPPRLTLITCLGDYGLDRRSKSRVIAICEKKES